VGAFQIVAQCITRAKEGMSNTVIEEVASLKQR